MEAVRNQLAQRLSGKLDPYSFHCENPLSQALLLLCFPSTSMTCMRLSHLVSQLTSQRWERGVTHKTAFSACPIKHVENFMHSKTIAKDRAQFDEEVGEICSSGWMLAGVFT